MGTKPVLCWAGLVLAGVALTGCQGHRCCGGKTCCPASGPQGGTAKPATTTSQHAPGWNGQQPGVAGRPASAVPGSVTAAGQTYGHSNAWSGQPATKVDSAASGVAPMNRTTVSPTGAYGVEPMRGSPVGHTGTTGDSLQRPSVPTGVRSTEDFGQRLPVPATGRVAPIGDDVNRLPGSHVLPASGSSNLSGMPTSAPGTLPQAAQPYATTTTEVRELPAAPVPVNVPSQPVSNGPPIGQEP